VSPGCKSPQPIPPQTLSKFVAYLSRYVNSLREGCYRRKTLKLFGESLMAGPIRISWPDLPGETQPQNRKIFEKWPMFASDEYSF